ncbi:uncharacterized protein C6orf136 homolog isoform X2 [Callorhinchus milii]|uniref:Uncharacterized protein n=1 Tax=Callorhinchus milii TaxID=7868 RepID=A0A4W3GN49_CALMI|nr:uncharacterized protein C6orf136 homolog isoform X2 [Callorhinchus milii]|eukprot:gi/632988407/ref/XP_007883094.1/ PREDICTED: uncharacterized protein C6orf136 homolog isoform X2 [Callorhinchus milii]
MVLFALGVRLKGLKLTAENWMRARRLSHSEDGFPRQISSLPWSMHPPVYTWGQSTGQLGAENCPAPSQDLAHLSLYSSCHAPRTQPGEVRIQSLVCLPEDKICLQLVVSGLGSGQSALLELPYPGLGNLDKMAALQARESGGHLSDDSRFLSRLEDILDSITTVDGRSQDDIAVERREPGSPEPAPRDQGAESGWDMSGGHLDSFRTLFESEWCRTPYPLLPHGLLAFAGTENLERSASDRGDPDMEEHLSLMYLRLRDQLPKFFLRPHDYGMYSPDLEFISEFPRIKTRGRTIYKVLLTLMKFLSLNYFADVQLEVLNMSRDAETWSVQVRWRVTGLPLHVLMLRFYKRDKTELYRFYDAFSTFHLGSDGLICRHKLDKMMSARPPVTKVKRLLVGALVALGLEEHRPALNLLLAQLTGKIWQ